jgi:hypothetical protein
MWKEVSSSWPQSLHTGSSKMSGIRWLLWHMRKLWPVTNLIKTPRWAWSRAKSLADFLRWGVGNRILVWRQVGRFFHFKLQSLTKTLQYGSPDKRMRLKNERSRTHNRSGCTLFS